MAQVDRINGLIGNQGMKTPVLCATTGAILLSGEQTIDGIACHQPSPTNSNRVLVKNQADQTTNGIYLCQALAWTREPDFDGALDVANGTLISVAQGNVNRGIVFQLTTPDVVVIGTSNLTFQAVLNGMLPFTSQALLKAVVNPVANAVYFLLGYNAPGDGGAGIFFWNAADNTADNGGTVLQLNSGGAGRFNKIL